MRTALAALALATALGLPTAAAYTATAEVTEDSTEWSCVEDGNRICGPGNSEGQPAACYDDGGVIVALWPCNPWEANMGHRHADGTTTYPNGDVLDDNGDDPR